MSDSPYLIEANENNFDNVVLEKSKEIPVLVDFWAEWCGPCRAVAPVLENLAAKSDGKFMIAKVDTDVEQRLAGRYGIRSLPTLKLFRHGSVVEEVMGAQPESALQTMIERHLERFADTLREKAAQAHMLGNNEEALNLLQEARHDDPNYAPVILDMAKIFINNHQVEEAEKLLKGLPINLQADQEVHQLLAKLDFVKIATNAPSSAELEATLAVNPNAHQARHQLSALKVLEGEYETALNNFLELMKRDRKFEDDAGRKGLIAVFNLLGNHGQLVTQYRGKMSSLLH